MTWLMWLSALGSIASIIGMGVSIYILWRENKIETEVHDLKTEEENWHHETKHTQ